MNIAVLGCGNMGRAIITGLRRKYGQDVSISAFDRKTEALYQIEAEVTVAPPEKWFSDKKTPEVVLVAVKPQDIRDALTVLRTSLSGAAADVLWISIAAGVSLKLLSQLLGTSSRICRVMPNTPSLIGEGISAYALNGNCVRRDSDLTEYVLSSTGTVIEVPEKMLDAVTGLSGSGPAYVYFFIEALIEGGVAAGLPYDIAKQCAVKTVIGAARMVDKSEETPGELKGRVMSPGGTTVSGMLELEKRGFKNAVIEAVNAAAKRAAELGS